MLVVRITSCRTYGARGVLENYSQRLRAGLTCVAPTALRESANRLPGKFLLPLAGKSGRFTWRVFTDRLCLHATTKTDDSEPGFGAVLAVDVAEFGFQDASFVSGAQDLHDDYRQHY